MGVLGFVGAGILLRYVPRYAPHQPHLKRDAGPVPPSARYTRSVPREWWNRLDTQEFRFLCFRA